jgi:hypothetical protein
MTENKESKPISDWKKREIGALWKRVSKSQQTFLTGKIRIPAELVGKEVEIVIYTNKDKATSDSPNRDKFPDLQVYLSKDNRSAEVIDSVAPATVKKKSPKPTENQNGSSEPAEVSPEVSTLD